MSNRLKMAQDRAALLISYDKMCKVFHARPIGRAQIAAMGNQQLMQLCKDLYNGAPIKKTKKLQKMMVPKEPFDVKLWVNSILARVKRVLHA